VAVWRRSCRTWSGGGRRTAAIWPSWMVMMMALVGAVS
jgi:hypothetical protein